jgi:hypothetical protein
LLGARVIEGRRRYDVAATGPTTVRWEGDEGRGDAPTGLNFA